MVIDKAQIKRTLIITLSNVGDVIMTTPVIRTIARQFPSSRIDVMAGPRAKEVFEKDPLVFKLIIYDKYMAISEKRRLQLKLKKLRYDLVIDIRNTIFPLLIGPKFRTSAIHNFPRSVKHRSLRHLHLLHSLGIEDFDTRYRIHVPAEDEECASLMLQESGVRADKMVVVNAGAKSHLKRWTREGFAEVCDRLMEECTASVVFTGLEEDADTVEGVLRLMKHRPCNFVGRLNLRQLAALMKRSRLVITNDSAPLHLACAVGAKVLAIFGPTDPRKYGPVGEFDIVINEKLHCSPCESAVCKYNYECMRLVSADNVFENAKMMIEGYG